MCNDRLPRENANTTTEMYPHPIKEQKKKKKMLKFFTGQRLHHIRVTYV